MLGGVVGPLVLGVSEIPVWVLGCYLGSEDGDQGD